MFLWSSIRRLGGLTEMPAFVALVLFLAQWHMLNRAQQLRVWAAKKAAQNGPKTTIK